MASSTVMANIRSQSPTLAVVAVVVSTIGLTFIEEYLNEEVYVMLGFVALAAYLVQTKKKAKKLAEDPSFESQKHTDTADGDHPWSNNSHHRGPIPRVQLYNMRITEAMKDKDWKGAEDILTEMHSTHVEPDVVTLNSFIQGYAQLGMLREAEAYLKKVEGDASMKADAYTYAPIVKAYAHRCLEDPAKIVEHLRTAERWLTRMRGFGIIPDVYLHNLVLDLLSKTEQGPRVDAWLFEMAEDGPTPSIESFNAGIGVWGRAGQPERMESWFKRMKLANVQMDYHTMDKLIMGYGKAGQVEKAVNVFDHVMSANNVAPHANNYNSMLRVFGRAGMFQEMETFFKHMKERGVRPGQQTYQAMLKAYSMAYQSDKVLWLIQEMRDDGLSPFQEVENLTMTLQSFGQEPWKSSVRQNQTKRACDMLKEAHASGAVIDKAVMVVFERLVGTVQATTTMAQLKLTNTGWTPRNAKLSGAARRC